MVVLISTATSATTGYGVNPKLQDESFRIYRWNSRSEVPFSSGLCGRKKKREVPILCLAVKNDSVVQTEEKLSGKFVPKRMNNRILSEGRDDEEELGRPICPGCGIFMQDDDPDLPGYYQKRKVTEKKLEGEAYIEGELDGYGLDGEVEEAEVENGINGILEENEGEDAKSESEDEDEDEFDWESDKWEAMFGNEEDDGELDGFAPAGVGYGNITEEVVEKAKIKRLSKAEKKKMVREESRKERDDMTVCARCHSLRNYGQVKNDKAENLIPDFDFERLISTRLIKPTSNSGATVIVMVIDCVDFDGSFPKRAAKSLFKVLQKAETDPKLSKKLPKLVLVATKVDLLPPQISPSRLDKWVRQRAKAGGAPKLSGVYLVSSRKDLGVRNLLAYIKESAGPRGNVWVIGAQNAGKSTLINALSKKEGATITRLTEAPVPGTTLGILRIGGVFPAKAKMYDTPGLLHPYLMSMRLNPEERKMIEIRKELQPRTYRVKAGQSVHIGGLVRLDLVHASVQTIYITVWASHSVSLHLGKTENAEEIIKSHSGLRLQPPIGVDRAYEMGEWQEKEIELSGSSWDVKSIDVAVAGLGWFSLGLKGEAKLALWTYQGIEVTLREPLVLDRAPFLERPGFWLPNTVSDTLGNRSKLDEARKKKKHRDSTDFLAEISP